MMVYDYVLSFSGVYLTARGSRILASRLFVVVFVWCSRNSLGLPSQGENDNNAKSPSSWCSRGVGVMQPLSNVGFITKQASNQKS